MQAADLLFPEGHFVCPRCGSHCFGSSRLPDDKLLRECHGENCKFTWNQDDDIKYWFVSAEEVVNLVNKQ